MIQEFQLPNIRKMFIPDSGKVIVDADLAGADAQVVAWEADDTKLKAAFREGKSVHLMNGEDLLGAEFTQAPDTTRALELRKEKCTMPSKDSSTGPTISEALTHFTETLRSVGPSDFASSVKLDGFNFTPESVTGISALSTTCRLAGASAINSAIESFILTELIPYCLKLSPGDLNLLLQRYALGVDFNSEVFHGSNFSFKCTIRWYSRSQAIDGKRPALLIPFEDIWKYLCHIKTPSSSLGESPEALKAGEIANSHSPCLRPYAGRDDGLECECHRKLGNDFWFLPKGSCLFKIEESQ
jgi:hypothetical protein